MGTRRKAGMVACRSRRSSEHGTHSRDRGFADFKRDIDPVMRGVPEAGWVFATHAHGQGYASEALAAALAWRDAALAVERTVCIINTLNLASIRVAEKAGFHGIGEGNFNEHTVRFFERFRAPAAT